MERGQRRHGGGSSVAGARPRLAPRDRRGLRPWLKVADDVAARAWPRGQPQCSPTPRNTSSRASPFDPLNRSSRIFGRLPCAKTRLSKTRDTRGGRGGENTQETWVPPKREAEIRTRAALVGAIAVLILALGVGGYAGWRTLTSTARPSDGEGIQSQPPADPVRCDGGDRPDQSRDRGTRSGGYRGRCLGTRCRPRRRPARSGHQTDRVNAIGEGCASKHSYPASTTSPLSPANPELSSVSATLSVLESRTCVEQTCDQHGAPNSANLTLRVDPVSGKVVAATAPPSPDSEQAESGHEE